MPTAIADVLLEIVQEARARQRTACSSALRCRSRKLARIDYADAGMFPDAEQIRISGDETRGAPSIAATRAGGTADSPAGLPVSRTSAAGFPCFPLIRAENRRFRRGR